MKINGNDWAITKIDDNSIAIFTPMNGPGGRTVHRDEASHAARILFCLCHELLEDTMMNTKTGYPVTPHQHEQLTLIQQRFELPEGTWWGENVLDLDEALRFDPVNNNSDCFWMIVKAKTLGLWDPDAIRGINLDGWQVDPWQATRRGAVRAVASCIVYEHYTTQGKASDFAWVQR